MSQVRDIDWSQLTLLLTATIEPNRGLSDNSRTDAQQRENDYETCLKFNLKTFPQIQRVVFAENSNWPLDRLRDVAAAVKGHDVEVEMLSLDANAFPGEFGKGYGEAMLIDLALQRSRLLQATPMMAKMTGRHLLHNMTSLIEANGLDHDLACDLRDHGIYERLGLGWCGRHFDTRFFLVRRACYEAHFAPLHREHTAGVFSIEAAFYHRAKQLESAGNVKCRFPIEPIYGGVAGHGGKNYDGLRERTKRCVRGLTRRWWPSLRI